MVKNVERKEAWMRIVVLIVSGIILYLWSYLSMILILVNFLIGIFTDKRNKDVAELAEYYNTESYKFFRYMSGVQNIRPFPFTSAERMSKFK